MPTRLWQLLLRQALAELKQVLLALAGRQQRAIASGSTTGKRPCQAITRMSRAQVIGQLQLVHKAVYHNLKVR